MSIRNEEMSGARSRRMLLKGLGLGAAGVAGMALLPGEARAQRGGLDVAVLNFALNLEYLEAEYYTLAQAGVSIADPPFNIGINGVGTLGPVVAKANPAVPFTPGGLIEQYAEEIAQDERNHVIFLRQALGTRAVARPAINLRDSFNAAISAATNGAVTTFDPFANEVNFLLGAFVFEDVGVTAYKGAARLLANKDFLEAAAGILAVEAYHAGNVRTVLAALNESDPGLGIAGVVQAISDLKNLADGPNDLDQGILDDDDRVNIVPANDFSIAFSRSAQQVLNIVYLNGQGTPGGFFPAGLNGEALNPMTPGGAEVGPVILPDRPPRRSTTMRLTLRTVPAALAALLALAAAPIAPAATIYAIGDGGASLLRFDSNAPGSASRVASFSGDDVFLDAIDFRPATGQLFGYRSATDSYFAVDVNTGALSLASAPGGAGAATNTFVLGMDWNPTIDRLRVVTESTQNIVFNPETGTSAAFTDLFYASGDSNAGLVPVVIDNAYTNSVAGATTTQQYVLDHDLNVLATLANNAGELSTVGEVTLGGSVLDFDDLSGFDISSDLLGRNTAFALLTVDGVAGLYTIDLTSGAAKALGDLGPGFGNVYSLAVAAVPEPSTMAMAGFGVAAAGVVAARRRRAKA